MRTIATVCLGLALGGCAAPGREPLSEGTMRHFLSEVAKPGSTQEARRTVDDAKCREYGFKPGTEAYGNCRLQLEQIRATRDNAPPPRN